MDLIALPEASEKLDPSACRASSQLAKLRSFVSLRRNDLKKSHHGILDGELERRTNFVILRAAVVSSLLFLSSLSWGQGQPHAVVVPATKHVTSPPLSQIAPIPPSANMNRSPDADRVFVRNPPDARRLHDSGVQSSYGAAAATSLTTNSGLDILGIGNGFPDYTEQANIPVANGAAGGSQFVQFVNESFAVFNKSNGNVVYGPADGNTLWQALGAPCSAASNLDEIAQFDKLANVWVMMMPLYTNPPYLCIAVSTTSDATGSWNLYAFEIPLNATACNCMPMPDYPKLGVWPDAYYISYYQASNLIYEGPAACAVDRSAMLSGDAATMQCFENNGKSNNGWLPSDVDGTTPPPSGTPNYFVNFDSNNQSLDLWEFHVDWTTPANSTFTGPTNIPVEPFLEPCGDDGTVFTPADNCVPQAGTSQMLGVFGDRLMYRLAYRNFGNYQDLVANHSVQVSSSGDQTGIRWYELRNTGSGFSVYQQGTYAPDSSYRWMGSIAMDHAGDIAVGYNVSSSSLSPSIRYTGRQSTDSLGTMEGEVDILSAAGVTPASQTDDVRWGDYSSMAVDPSDDCTFWYTNEYQAAGADNHWSTRIASFTFPGCVGFTLSSSPSALTVGSGSQGTVTVTVTPTGGFNSTVSFSCSGLPTGATCSFSPSEVTPSGAAVTSQLTVSVAAQASALRQTPIPFLPLTASFAAFCLIGWRKARGPQLVLLLAVGFGLLSACGGGSGVNSKPVTSTLTITATAGSSQQTTSVSLTVN
jgi:hypothetical protein